jgi:hypothetical protein
MLYIDCYFNIKVSVCQYEGQKNMFFSELRASAKKSPAYQRRALENIIKIGIGLPLKYSDYAKQVAREEDRDG